MNAHTIRSRTLVLGAALALTAAAAAWHVLSARAAERATPDSLGGEARFLTHVSTDKPLYKIGEPVFVRGVVLHAHSLRPLPDGAQPQAQFEIKGPKGETVASGQTAAQDSVLGFRWDVPEGQAGGEYRVRVTWPWEGYAPAERSFEVRAYRAPRLKNQIVFLRDGYGPGDTVVATLHTERAEGGIPAGAGVEVIARVDGVEVHRGRVTVDDDGNARAEFALPARIARGDGTLAFVIEDGGVVETAAKTLPILLQTVDLQLFPEGGALVAGLETRVYLEARTPSKRPADIAGVVVDRAGREVASFRTEHEGRGRFAFTPDKGESYTLKITEPSGIDTTWPLPEGKVAGGVLVARDDVTMPAARVRLRVGVAKAGRYAVTLSKREKEVASATVELKGGETREVALKPAGDADGVLVATLWDADGQPVAERLVFREPERALQVRLATDTQTSVPGEKVALTVETTDEDGQPVSAVVGITVTDESVIELLEKREQPPRLPVMVLLEDDVRELADAHVYLDPKNDEAPRAVDLLLGTQGWRRFAFVDAATLLREHGDAARRVLALQMSTRREVVRTRGHADDRMRGGMRFGRDMPAGMPEPAMAVDDAPAPPEEPAAMDDPAPPADEPAAAVASELASKVAVAKDIRDGMEAGEARRMKQDILVDEDLEEEPAPPVMVFVREYAHMARPDRRPGERVDFTETLYWSAGVRTDAETGRATVEFALNDAVTTFRASADAFSADGALGEGTETIESVEPFFVEPKLPLELTAGDRVQLPVSVVSGVGEALRGVTLVAEAGAGLHVGTTPAFDLAARQRARRILDVRAGEGNGPVALTLAAKAGAYADRVTRTVAVVPRGFPVERSFGGMVAAKNAALHEVTIPKNVVPNSITTEVALYPTPLANLTGALERLIQEPCGCFEQTSSTTYPLVMAQQYFTTHQGVDPSLVERSKKLLQKGYDRLKGFECRKKGYEWFGEDPGHEALTAFGLLEFTDMAAVHTVDRAMIDRTRAWLLATRNGKGGFQRGRRALHTWIEDQDCSDGYILWALLEAGEPAATLKAEVDAVGAAAAKSDNFYVVALGANVLALAGRAHEAKDLMKRLSGVLAEDGHVGGGTQSIVGSRGEALDVETTALAVLAWLREPSYAGNVEKAMRWLTSVCEGGRFGSTQSTVLALRAIVAYDQARARPKAPGRVRAYVDDQPVGDWVRFDEKTQGAITLPDLGELLTAGDHRLAIRMEDGAELPYAITVRYHDEVPDSSKACRVDLSVELNSAKLEEGGITEATVTVVNRSGLVGEDEPLPMVVAIVGLPGGIEPRHDRLKELKDAHAIDAWEVRGREVILYWRGMKPAEEKTVALSLVAAVPGTYTGPASRAYEYYGDEHKTWAPPLTATITPRAE